jgi:hypothetical protein
MNPKLESTLPPRVKDNDTVLAMVQWGLQFVARPLVKALDKERSGIGTD